MSKLERLSANTKLFYSFLYAYRFPFDRQMLTYGRRIPLPELDKRIDVSLSCFGLDYRCNSVHTFLALVGFSRLIFNVVVLVLDG